ncbi:hypothetical protein [Brevibacillus fortis]|uniref:Uncharacterized protein n=1 Tax=Brevibacillus fortis TaxID=2126352 RepID=A0A2P7UT65_9BACL|nr:hypothetical protein [Brevibacillus fortis]PSJ90171.1 hypothetical protein C7R93_22610 [Brevibacillus fortis]
MEHKIITYYINGLSNHRLITKKIKKWVFGYALLSILWAFTSVVAFSNKLFWVLLLAFFLEGVGFFIINHRIKVLLRQVYNCRQNGLLWDDKELNNFKMKKLERILAKYKMDTDTEKLNKLAEVIGKEAENYKIGNYIGIGIIALLFVPIWSEFIGWIYSKSEDFSMAVLSMGIMIIVALLLWQFLWILKVVFEIFDGKSHKMKELALMIDRICLKK